MQEGVPTFFTHTHTHTEKTRTSQLRG